jgi:hypothetical protein
MEKSGVSTLVRYSTSAERGERLGAAVAVGVELFAACGGGLMPQTSGTARKYDIVDLPPLREWTAEFHVYLHPEPPLFPTASKPQTTCILHSVLIHSYRDSGNSGDRRTFHLVFPDAGTLSS